MVNLCQHNGISCFGCCGPKLGKKEDLQKDIEENTKQFAEFKKEGKSLKQFRNRYTNWNFGKGGACRNLIQKDGQVFCSIHPKRNPTIGKDLREGHCDHAYMCNTFKHYNRWHMKKKEAFVQFLLEKKLDNYDYSVNMDNGKLMKEFEEKNKKLILN